MLMYLCSQQCCQEACRCVTVHSFLQESLCHWYLRVRPDFQRWRDDCQRHTRYTHHCQARPSQVVISAPKNQPTCPAGSYGSTKRYKSFERLKEINSKIVIGAGGELSDFQYTMTLLEELMLEDFCLDDDIEMSPKEVFAYLNRVVYNRRTKWVADHCCFLHPT